MFAIILDISSKASLRLSECLHQYQHHSSQPALDYEKIAVVSREIQPQPVDVTHRQHIMRKHPSAKHDIRSPKNGELRRVMDLQQPRGWTKHGKPRYGRWAVPDAVSTTSRAWKHTEGPRRRPRTAAADSTPIVEESQSSAPKRKYRPKYPLELESVYRQAKAQNTLTKVDKESKGKVSSSHRSEAALSPLAKQSDSLSRVMPAAAVNHSLPSSYQASIETLEESRVCVDARKQEYKIAKAGVFKAQATLQCVLRRGECAPKFWVKQKQAAEKLLEKTMKALGSVRLLETKAIHAVSADLIKARVLPADDYNR